MATTKEYRGRIRVRDECEYGDGLYLDLPEEGWEEPLADRIEQDIEQYGRYLSVSYWITDEPHTKEEVQEAWVLAILGDSDVKFQVHGSDITGYLFTDEKIMVGGHDLLVELASNDGKFAHLTITYSTNPQDVVIDARPEGSDD